MKRIFVSLAVVIGLSLGLAGQAHASSPWSEYCYSGYQPWWNIFAKRYKCLTPEEERLQKFWHDYYDALENYYGALNKIDWVAYYKNHGVPVCGGGGCAGGRINYYPVTVVPNVQWGVPSNAVQGPMCPPMQGPGPMMMPPGMGGGFPQGPGGM